MPKKERWTNCVVLYGLKRPGLIWRFFRRIYFYRLNRKIEALPKTILQMGKKYDGRSPSSPLFS